MGLKIYRENIAEDKKPFKPLSYIDETIINHKPKKNNNDYIIPVSHTGKVDPETKKHN